MNSIPSSCSTRNCSFIFSPSTTPTLSSVSPTSGSFGTELSLTGSGFKPNKSDVTVTIGGKTCSVTKSASSHITCTVGQLVGGQHEVAVQVNNEGFASSSGKVIFTYVVTINSVSPQRGSIAGGTVLTIKGDGFGDVAEKSTVTLGDSLCVVLNSNLTIIKCITSVHTPALVNLNVTVGAVQVTRKGAFQYNLSVTPSILSISPLEGNIWGGNELLIQGKGFGPPFPGNVKIGSKPCKVITYSSGFINCSTPAQAPGKYDVTVYVDGKGYAANGSRPPQYEYTLRVRGVSPRHGSIFGGTVVNIHGRGFGSNTSATVVTFGDVPCEVVSSRDTEIICQTKSSSKTHLVDNSGVHAGDFLSIIFSSLCVFVWFSLFCSAKKRGW